MINKNRVAPIGRLDLITLYATMLNLSSDESLKSVAAVNAEGDFKINVESEGIGTVLLDEPVKRLIFSPSSDQTISPTGKVYFIAGYNFDGLYMSDGTGLVKLNGNSSNDEIVSDACSLYVLDLSNMKVTNVSLLPTADEGSSEGGGGGSNPK